MNWEADGEVFVFPASFAQRRLWFLDRLQPGNPAYNLPAGLLLSGPLRREVLLRTLAGIVARHESLRTTFALLDGEPVQVIDPEAGTGMPLVDLGSLGPAERTAELARLFGEESRRPFDLARGPLLRTVLIHLAEREHALLFNLHHIVGDGWSMGVLVREVGALYRAFDQGVPSPLPPLPLQYADFAQAQRDWLRGEVLDEQLAYWRRQLSGSSRLELPADHPPPAVPGARAGTRSVLLSADLIREIGGLACQRGTTLFIALLAALKTLLYRYTQREDVSVGTVVAGRNHLDTEGMIGFFANTLVLRTRFEGAGSFLELLERVNRVAVEAYAHQDVPFEKLVDELRPARDLDHTPFFDVMFVLQNTPPAALELSGLTLSPIPAQASTAKFDWSLNAVETGDGLLVELEYSAGRFDAATIERSLAHWRRLLEGIVEEPGRSLSGLPMLAGPERRQILEWGRGESAELPALTLHELFERQAARTPEALAVIAGEEAWTYGELNRRANRLARRLSALGAGPETSVGLCLERSPAALVAMLGILKAGGAYVPLDPELPAERLRWILDNAGAVALVTVRSLRERLDPGASLPAVLLDADGEALALESDADAASGAGPDNAAYILFTSGTTGRPKGVLVAHRGVVNVLRESLRLFGAAPGSRVIQLASLSFDASVLEIFLPLLAGGAVCPVPRETLLSGPRLARELERLEISILIGVPAHFSILPPGEYPALATVVTGSERCPPEAAARWSAGRRFFNAYGPTEALIYSTVFAGPGSRAQGPPIGRPLRNNEAHLLDPELRLVPAGVMAELYLGGAGLARGYFDRPDLTAERFVPHPFAVRPGERLYRTGDLARRLPDGNLEFLGRSDQQVKLRGFRVEPGEIEAVLSDHPDVAEAAVAVQREGGEAWLVAYVVPRRQPGPAPAELREACRLRLPAYMVPSAFVTLPEMPRTAALKIDRAALPALRREGAAARSSQAASPPATATQELLLGIWEEVLAVAGAGAHDDFFELGGHSLLAVRLLSRVRDAWDAEIPLRTLFERPTVAALAAAIDEHVRGGGGLEAPPIEPAPRQGALPLSFAQERLWVLDRLDPGRPIYNMPFAVRLGGPLAPDALERSLGELLRRHEVLRTRYAEAAGGPVQIVEPAAGLPLPAADLSGLPPDAAAGEVARLAGEEARRPFDLGRTPPLRALLVRLPAGDHVLCLVVHHIACDGWSMPVLIRDLKALYAAGAAGAPAPLPELPVQYADYAVWQRRWLQGAALERQAGYWRGRLAGLSPLDLRGDRPRPAVRSFRGGLVPLELGAELSGALQALARRQGATLFMLLLAAFQALLHRYTGQEDIVVGSPTANRDRREIEELIGCFVNMLALRAEVPGSLSFSGLLERVREMTLGAYAHRELPFERLVEEIEPERDLSRNPVFQVVFQVLSAGPEPARPATPELSVEPFGVDGGTARFDLSLALAVGERGIAGTLDYSSDLFDPSSAALVAEHLRALLQGIAADPGLPVAGLPLLTAAGERQLLALGQGPRGDSPLDLGVHELFRLQAARTPGAVAVLAGEASWSYEELSRRAHGIARRLRRLGIGPEQPVALFLGRSPEAVAALLGVLEAGGCFVPLDPFHPRERLEFLLRDSGTVAILTDGRHRERLPESGLPVLLVEETAAAGPETPDLPPPPFHPRSLAYVLYTSGSTGRPKGVMVEHRALVNYLSWVNRALPCLPMPALARWSFDAFLKQVLAPLLRGGRAWLLPESVAEDPGALLRALGSGESVGLNCVPSLWRSLLERMEAERLAPPAGLAALLLGGEALEWELLERTRGLAPGLEIWNLYGPTETTANATAGRLREGGRVTLGAPVANTRVHVLDSALRPVPPGVPGEIHVAGEGLARGYRGRPDLTAERFLPDPLAAAPGERLYRTGDRARLLPAGGIEFLGRTDAQLKVRGFRIEPGEVEAALGSHPAVVEAAAAAHPDPAGDPRLAVHVVFRPGIEPSASELREFLGERLPAYMIPSAFVRLEALPRTSGGKVDRAALRAAALPEMAPARGRETPGSLTEELMTGIWKDLLAAGDLGVHDDFFSLGGHSLLAVRLLSRVRDAFGVEVPPRTLFDRPTVAGLTRAVEDLQRGGGGDEGPALVPVPWEGALPLSFPQQRLWLLDQITPGLAVYNIPLRVRITGRLDPAVLERALAEILGRHEALRTRFAVAGGNPVQIVEPAPALGLPGVDLRGLPASVRDREVERLAAGEAGRSFDLTRAPLVRAALLRTSGAGGAAEHVLLLTFHHIAADAWSLEVLARELAVLYDAFAEGRLSPLPELPVQYGDYAVWQRRWLQGERLEGRLAHWRERLTGAAALELPGDRPRPRVQSFRGGHVPLAIDPGTARDLQALARGRGTTLFMVMLAAFQALLHRLADQEDVVVGVPSANRDRSEIEGLIGFFINMLPLRTRLSGSLSFLDLLARVREVALDAYAHRDLPFERLVEEIQPERDLSRNPVFQVALQVVRGAEPAALRDVVLSPLDLPAESARFDLNLAFAELGTEIRGVLEYSSDLFDRSTASRIADQLVTLLTGVAADPGRRLDALPLLGPAERHQLLAEWNDTASAIPREACVQDLFARAAARAPDAVAVVFGEDRLTYAELDRRAAGLARHLRELGVGPDVLTGVCLERSPELVVALLGILKAGGAYLPLDPSYPPERLAFMMDDASAPVLITTGSFRDRLPAGGAAVVCLEALDLEALAGAGEPVAHGGAAESLAYVVYTSGSTGRPKGVAVPHRAIVRLALGSDYACLGPEDRVAQASNASFDAATWEIWGALLNGACLVGVARDVALEPRELAAQLRERGITALFLTTALFNQLAREAPGAFSSLRHLLFGGEAVDPSWVGQVLRDGPPERLLHVYGPTESTTFTSWFRIEEVPEAGRTVPIGRPIGNTRIGLLDRGFEPVPIGAMGEVYIGGEGLARGYLGRPELTAERFVPDPAGRGERLYRTGDLARRRPDGAIEFAGRTDHQVKVRGFRIEPGEIQAVLEAHPRVGESCVLAREEAGDRRLVAYVVPRTGAAPGAAELREFLRERLPDYMVPSAFVTLAGLPLTPNGKIDRAALPAPALADAAGFASGEEERAAPRTPTEELLLAIWEELFAGGGIGIRDDFFALGGHSLLAVQLISRVREAFAVEVPLRALFDRPTVEGLAEEVERALRAGEELEAPPLLPAGRDQPVPLSFAQQRLWVLDQLEVGLTAYNVPMALRLDGVLAPEALRRSLEEIVHRHEALRTGFDWMDGNPVQAIFPPEPLVLPGVDLAGLPAEARSSEVARLAREEAVGPFDLEVDRLFRLALLILGPREHVLLVTLHHIVSDGWSMGVLVRELSALYAAFRAGLPSPLAALPVQYADYAVWQRRWMTGEALERQLAYWRTALAGLQTLELPTDRPHRSVHTFAGGSRSAVLPRELSGSLAALCRSRNVTPFMALLAASTALLHRATGQTRVTVGSPIASRNRVEIEGLIGFFVNTLVLSTDVSGDPAGQEALRRVREVTLGAFAHQDMPFQKLVEEFQPQRSLQRSPLFQVFFALQNVPRPAAELPGLTLSTLPVDTGTAKFELSLGFVETAAGLVASVEYNRDLFDGATAGRLLGHLENVLAGLVGDPERTLSALPVLSEPESQQLVVEWNDTRRGDLEGSVIHRLFEEHAAAFPEAVALLAGEERISYGRLNRRANRLARHLRRLGVGLEVPVGIYLDSSPDLILGYLAVLKAGGAYLPLGTAYPAERLAFLLADTGAPVVLTRRGLSELLPASGARTVELDAEPEPFAGEREDDLTEPVSGDGLAYILYTSGSTGRPKGVACTHEGVVRLVRESGWADFAGEVFLQITAITFDVSTFEIWGALLNGGRLAFLTSPSPTLEELGEAVTRHDVTTLFLASGLFGLMVDRRLEDLRPLRQLVAGGDVVPVPQARRVVEELPDCRLINGYGPTENTTFTTGHTVTPDDVYRPSIPIGRPIGNSTTYVLDDRLRPVAAGVRGVLYTGGLGVARCYFGRPDLTAESFVPDPFSLVPGVRLYRTGDLARWLADGTIEFFGRRDTQVKIRGFRIEPGEVETALGRHPAVAEAVVIAREDRPGNRRLAAYLVAASGPAPETADLQAFLRRSLPDYMVPSVFVTLDALPLTPNGKVDRAALPAPEDVARESQASFVPPRTQLEEQIAGVWREVLRVPRVGVHDNFFDLGGHSLLLLQAVSRLSEVLGRQLPKGQMFEHPTVAALAQALGDGGDEEPAAPSLEPSQVRAAARRESLRQRRHATVRETAPRLDPLDDTEDGE